MEWAHALLAIFSAFRLTTLFTSDAIWTPVRERFPQVPWHCSLCMSVWAGIAATVFLLAAPYLNWPLAISWLYLFYERTRKVDNDEMVARVNAMAAEYQGVIAAVSRRVSEMGADLASAVFREKKLQSRIEELEKAAQPKEPANG